MRKSTITVAAISAAAAMALAGCGSSGGKGGSSGGSGGGSAPKVTSACKLTNPPTASASAPATSTTTAKASGKVGVILPDTTSSTRYTTYDAPLLTKNLQAAGLTPIVQNAQGSTSTFTQDAQNMIGQGIKVLIMDSIDPTSGAAVEKLATQAGVKVIDYDRVNLGGTAQYYVSFDNEDVGRLQAQAMMDCFAQQNVKDPRIIMVDGGTDVDNNAVLFAKGAHTVFDPMVKAGKLTIVQEVVDKGWDVNNVSGVFQPALTAAQNNIQGVYAANDGIANAVIGVLKPTGLAGHVVLTGQDSGVEGLQNILNGEQSLTIFKKVQLEADAASQLAVALISGQDPSSVGLTLNKFDDPKDPSHNIQALLLPAQVITQANVEDVVKAGGLTAADICANIAAKCSEFGVS